MSQINAAALASLDNVKSTLQACCFPTQVPPGGLKNLGNGQFETQRYLISVKNGEVEVFDKQTKTSVKAWGDPHLTTGDGDKMQFQKDNLTLDLADGTKLTIKPTAPNADGISTIDSLAIMTPSGGELVENITNAPTAGKHFDSSLELDQLWNDGTVLRAGNQVDDLFYASNGQQIVGGDPTARFGEVNLDGAGGHSAIDFTNDLLKKPLSELANLNIGDLLKLIQGGAHQALPKFGQQGLKAMLERIQDLLKNGGAFQSPKNPTAPTPGQGFDNIRQLIAAIMAAIQHNGAGNTSPLPGKLPGFNPGDFGFPSLPKFPGLPTGGGSTGSVGGLPTVGNSGDSFKNAVFGQLGGLDSQITAIKNALASGQVPPEQAQQLQLQLQELLQQKNELINMYTSILKTEHDERMAVIRNLSL